MRLLFRCRAAAAAALFLAASACSSGFNSLPAPSSAMRSAALNTAADDAAMHEGYATLRLRIWVPGRTHDSVPHRALPAYVSSATRKVAVTVQGANQSSPTTQKFRCTAVCSGKILAPLGVDLITLQLEDKKNRVLSRGSATVLVFKKNGNVFDFTLDGVPASVALVPESNSLPVVPASSGYVNFDARDADGRIITPDGHYTDASGNPLVFDVKASNHAFRLAVKTVSAPGAPIPFSYKGTGHVGTVTLTAKAARGIHTTVTFHPSALSLVPGIASRISPPMPIQVLTATQVPMSGSSTGCGGFPCFDPNKIFVLGNSGEQQVALAFNVTNATYGLAQFNAGEGGPFVQAPVDLGGNGFYGFFSQDAGGGYGTYDIVGGGASYGGTGNPCPSSFNVPIGKVSTTLFCSVFVGPNVYDATASTFAAGGYERKIRTLNGTTYIVTTNTTTPPQQVYTYVGGVSTLVPGAISMGANVTAPTSGFYGNLDGSVSAIGGATVATFSHAIEDVVGYGSSIFVIENGGIFGFSSPSGTFETAPLHIGNVVEVVTGVAGAPMLVESDGTLDVMGI